MSVMELGARVAAQARTVDPVRLLLTMLAAVFYVIGWSVGKLLAVTWFVVCSAGIAVKLGFIDARSSSARGAT